MSSHMSNPKSLQMSILDVLLVTIVSAVQNPVPYYGFRESSWVQGWNEIVLFRVQ